MEKKSINVYNLLIIDESGSMHSIYKIRSITTQFHG